MTVSLALFFFCTLLFFCSSPILTAIAAKSEDHVFVTVKNSNINVKDLRTLLDKRGLSYHTFHEKSEYTDALIESGPLTIGELKTARDSNADKILSSDNVEELIEDIEFEKDVPENVMKSKREIWLVRIEPNDYSAKKSLDEIVWRRLITNLNSFEVRFGRFNCKEAIDYCTSKGWYSPTLVLVAPRLHNSVHHNTLAEAYVLQTIRTTGTNEWAYEVDSVLKQVYSLSHGKLVNYLSTEEDFNALQTSSYKCSVHLVLFTNLHHSPFLMSALAAKFNFGTYCFAFGPKSIIGGTSINPHNQDGAYYAVKSHYYYSNHWQIVPKNQSIASRNDDGINAMVTFESLSRLLIGLTPIEAAKPNLEKRKPSKNKKSPPPKYNDSSKQQKHKSKLYSSPKYSYSSTESEYRVDSEFCLKFFGGLLLAFIIFLLLPFIIRFCNKATERRNAGQFARYQADISSRNRPELQNFWADHRVGEEHQDNNDNNDDDEEEEEHEPFVMIPRSYHLSRNGEVTVSPFEVYFTILPLWLRYISAGWHKRVFSLYNLRRTVGKGLRRLIVHYGIQIEEIGFPPYKWILRLPTVETTDLSNDNGELVCPICQSSVNNSDERLCRLPCNCRNVVYHYNCIAPWLIKRDDPMSHTFTSGTLHTERPCPMCRYDVTNWGLRQY